MPAGQTCREETQTRTCEEDGTWSDWSGNSRIVACEVETGDARARTARRIARALGRPDHHPETGGTGPSAAGEPDPHCARAAPGVNGRAATFFGCAVVYFELRRQAMAPTETRERFGPGQRESGPDVQQGNPEAHLQCRRVDRLDRHLHGDGLHGAASSPSATTSPTARPRPAPMTKPGKCRGKTCESEQQTRTCNDGVWSDWEGDDTAIHQALLRFAGQKRCNKPGGGTIAHEAKYTYSFYTSATVPYGQTCKRNAEVICLDGTAPVHRNGTQDACTKVQPVGCVDGGITKPHGATRTQIALQGRSRRLRRECQSETQTSPAPTAPGATYVGAGSYTRASARRTATAATMA